LNVTGVVSTKSQSIVPNLTISGFSLESFTDFVGVHATKVSSTAKKSIYKYLIVFIHNNLNYTLLLFST
jgi:hypothetical protein